MACVYTLAAANAPHAVRYVGATIRPIDVRFAQHVRAYNSDKSVYKQRWIESLSADKVNLVCSVIEDCDKDSVWDREKYWIAKFKADGARLTNIHAGGKGGAVTEESRKKISAALVGKKRPPHVVAQMRVRGKMFVGENNPNYGKSMKPHVKAALVKAMTGKVYDEAAREQMRQTHIERGINRKVTPETVAKIFEMRHVQKLSQQKIADAVGLSQTQISQMLLGKKWAHLGLVEKYKC